jgi:hypothetical protein
MGRSATRVQLWLSLLSIAASSLACGPEVVSSDGGDETGDGGDDGATGQLPHECWTRENTSHSGLLALWTSGDQLVAFGDDELVVFDGENWTIHEPFEKNVYSHAPRILGESIDSVWLGISSGVHHWDGEALETVFEFNDNEGMVQLGGSAPDNIWALTYDPDYNARLWRGSESVDVPVLTDPIDLWADDAEVWISTGSCTIAHAASTVALSEDWIVEQPLLDGRCGGMAVDGGEVWVQAGTQVGDFSYSWLLHRDVDGVWTQIEVDDELGIFAGDIISRGGEVWTRTSDASGDSSIRHFDGTTWTQTEIDLRARTLSWVDRGQGEELIAVGSRNGHVVVAIEPDSLEYETLWHIDHIDNAAQVWGTDAEHLIVAHHRGVARRDENGWTSLSAQTLAAPPWGGLAALSLDEGWLVAEYSLHSPPVQSPIWRIGPDSIEPVPLEVGEQQELHLRDVVAISPAEAWAGGFLENLSGEPEISTAMWRYDGQKWAASPLIGTPSPTSAIMDLAGDANIGVFAMLGSREMLQWKDATWQQLPTPWAPGPLWNYPSPELAIVSDELWVLMPNDDETHDIYRYIDEEWSQMPGPIPEVRALGSAADGQAWLLGTDTAGPQSVFRWTEMWVEDEVPDPAGASRFGVVPGALIMSNGRGIWYRQHAYCGD